MTQNVTSATPAPPAQVNPSDLNLLPTEKRLLYLLAAIQFSHIVDFMVMMPLGPLLAREFGIVTHEFGALVSSYTFAAAASGLACAFFIDRFERKRFLLVMYALFALATLACALAPNFAGLLVARALAGVFGGVLGALVNTVVADRIPPIRRGQAMGVVSTAFAMSTVLGVPASLWLANHWSSVGWRAPFFVVALLASACSVVAYYLLPKGAAPAAVQGNEMAAAWERIRSTLADRNHQMALWFAMFIMGSSFTVIPYLTIYATMNLQFPEQMLPVMYLLGGAVTFFTAPLIGRWADRVGKLHVFRIMAVIAMVPVVGITHLGPVPPWMYLCITTVFFVVVNGRWVPGQALVAGAASQATRGTFMSLLACAMSLALGIASYVSGHIIHMDATGRIVGFEYAGYLAAFASLMALWLAGKVSHRA